MGIMAFIVLGLLIEWISTEESSREKSAEKSAYDWVVHPDPGASESVRCRRDTGTDEHRSEQARNNATWWGHWPWLPSRPVR